MEQSECVKFIIVVIWTRQKRLKREAHEKEIHVFDMS